MSVMSKGADWLERQRHAHMTVEVEYQRGENALTLQATIGRTIFETTDDYGRITKIESRDFLIRACDLVFDTQITTPTAGDKIIEGDQFAELRIGAGHYQIGNLGVTKFNPDIVGRDFDESDIVAKFLTFDQ